MTHRWHLLLVLASSCCHVLVALDSARLVQTLSSRRAGTQAKQDALAELTALRQANSSAYQGTLQQLLDEVDGVQANRWATCRWPVPVPSRRVRLATLGRLVDATMGSDDSAKTEKGQDGQEGADRLRRSALALLLRELASAKSVRSLERDVARRQRQQAKLTMEDMLANTPPIGTPKYEVLDDEPLRWEVRKYEPFPIVSTTVSPGVQGSATAFNTIAGYIFGKNLEERKMAMTTPVLTTPSTAAAGGDRMSFVLEGDAFPQPRDEDQLRVETDPLGEWASVAVSWFPGYAASSEVAAQEKELRRAVELSAKWELVADAPAVVMRYNDPFTLPWKRRNEVALPVQRAAGGVP